MKKITDFSADIFNGKTALVRVDYNVPVVDGKVLDDARIRASFQTIQFLREHGASVILISHIENKQNPSLKPIAIHLQELFKAGEIDFEVVFHADLQIALSQPKSIYSQDVQVGQSGDISQKQVHLFENLRSDEGEKTNDPVFANRLADLADMYINEAFPVCHREHASVVALPGLFPKTHMAGFTLIDEIAHIEKGLHPTRPFLFLLGGAKFETKLPLIEKFLAKADKVVIGGALFNDVLKAKGYEVGKSLVSEGGVDISHVIEHPALLVPEDVQVIDTKEAKEIEGVKEMRQNKHINAIGHEDMIVDIGTSLVDSLKTYIRDCKAEGKNVFILWNGPMGLYEKGYTDCTKGLAELFISEDLEGLVGGGDTSAAIADVAGVTASGSHMYVSTGGGAMIEYLMNETLSGIEALK